MRILNIKDDGDRILLKYAPKISDFYSDEDREFYNKILGTFDVICIKYVSNDLLIRGLDYYTSTVFEFTTTDLDAQATVLAAVRYDNLIE